jgi:putative inorganic carbon (HCO3(-)) transporter
VALIRSRLVLYLGLLGLAATILFVPRVQERVIGIRSVDETAQLRIVSWENALGIISDHPVFGIGYNLYREAQLQAGILKDPTAHSATGSDSSLLLVTATTGIVGLVAFLWLLVALAREAIRTAAAKNLSAQWRAVGLGTAAAFAALFVHSQFVNSLLYPHLMEFIWIMAAVVVMVRSENATE